MKRKYYFLATALPPLQIGAIPEIEGNALRTLLTENLSSHDAKKVLVIRLLYDIENIRAMWLNEPYNSWGIFSDTLEEALLSDVGGFPPYVYQFLEKHESLEKRLEYFPSLLAEYFRQEIKHSKGFLKKYLLFERELRLVLAAFRAKKLGRDLYKEFQFEDPDESLIGQILAFKDSKEYEPPDEFLDLKEIFMHYHDSPFGLYQALCEYRFNKIEEMVDYDQFSIDRVLAYITQFFLVQKWLELDRKKGLEIVNTIVKEAL